MSDDEPPVIDLPDGPARQARLWLNRHLPAIVEEAQGHAEAAERVLCSIEAGARTYASRMTADFTRSKTLEPARFVVQQLRMMATGPWRSQVLDLQELDTEQGIPSLRLVAADRRRKERQNRLYSELLAHAEAILEAAKTVNGYLASLH